uniref:Gypsy retrotransposon integrase-like protein 1 n=1 Tax=Leptobrachium leishanense TaxID=445787 RepID=A0A8C5MK70_9ANUR
MPPRGKVYPLSIKENQIMEEYIKENLERGFIRRSSSPAGAGFFFVSKKEGDLCLCIDFRGLNKITIKNVYPIPLISELFDRLRGSAVYTKLDLRGAYNLIRIKEGHEWKTAFNTRSGHYEYLVMPFGLCNAPAVFQDFINDVFRDFLQTFVIVYLDDILIYSPDLKTHHAHVRQVLAKLLDNGLYCKLEKCLFDITTVKFLGYIITPEGFEMDPSKLTAISEWPLPQGLKAIQRFLGFSNYYRRFIKNYSAVASPIINMTRKGLKNQIWSSQSKQAFEALKQAFTSAPVLRHPDPRIPFVLEVDASEIGIGAVLSQRESPGKPLHPCGFFSRKLSPAERNYDIGNRELLAIVSALSEWRHLLEGTLDPLLIITDHKNLTYIGDAKRLNARQARWSLLLSRFNFVLTYRPGDRNVKADALSRQYDPYESNTQDHNPIVPPERIVASTVLSVSSPFLERLQAVQVGAPPDKPPDMLFVPEKERQELLIMFHDSKPAGHPGITKTLTSISRQFWWPTMRQDVRLFVLACQVCARSKTSKSLPVGLLQPLPTPKRPWSHLSMDFIVDLLKSKGHTVVLTVVDRFSKMAHFIPVPKLPTAKELAVVFAREIVRIHGVPSEIVSDRGAQFVSRFGGFSVRRWGCDWPSLQHIIHKLMGQQRGQIRVSSSTYVALPHNNKTIGRSCCPGLSMHVITPLTRPLATLLFLPSMVFSLRLYCFSLLNRPSRLSMTISLNCKRFGDRFEKIWSAMLLSRNARLTGIGYKLPPITWGIEFGCPLGT